MPHMHRYPCSKHLRVYNIHSLWNRINKSNSKIHHKKKYMKGFGLYDFIAGLKNTLKNEIMRNNKEIFRHYTRNKHTHTQIYTPILMYVCMYIPRTHFR